MEKTLESIKWVATVTLSYIASALGGYDSIMSLLVTLMLADLVTGLIYAIIAKKVNSATMEIGIVRKSLVLLIILIAYKLDMYIIEMHGSALAVFGVDLSLRTLAIAYYCIKESISLIENLANIGVPFPTGIKDILVQVSNYSNKSMVKAVANWLSLKFRISINVPDSDNEDKINEEHDKKE